MRWQKPKKMHDGLLVIAQKINHQAQPIAQQEGKTLIVNVLGIAKG